MRKVWENARSMFDSVIACFNSHMDLIVVYEALMEKVNELKGIQAEISSKNRLFTTVAEGKAEDKEQLREQLTVKLMKLVGKLFSYAKKVRNNEIKEFCSISRSDVDRKRDTDFSDFSKTILSYANLNVVQLAGYLITPEFLLEIEGLIAQYDNAAGIGSDSIEKRKAATTRLKELVSNGRRLLSEDVDKLMLEYEESNPDFLNEYKFCRDIKNIGIRHEPVEDGTTPQTPQ